MANNWYDDALTLKDKDPYQTNNQKMKKDNERPPTKRTMYENLRSSKSRRLTARQNVTRQSLVNSEVDDEGYDEDDEDNDDGNEENKSDYAYAAPVIASTKMPRVQTSDGPEGCSCFPKRSNKRIPSMLYEGLQCRHTGLKGETHAGVSKFDHNWREEYEEPDPSGVMTQKTNYYLGYPRPVNLDPDLQYYDEDYEGPEDKKQNDRTSQTEQSGRKTGKSKKSDKTSKSKQNKKEKQKKESFPYGLLDFMIEEGQTPPNSKPQNEGMPITLPRIGYSPPPPPSRDRLSARSVARSLPPLPESPFLSSRQNKINTSRSEKRVMSDINGNDVDDDIEEEDEDERLPTGYSKRATNVYEHGQRKFTGHYYDPATKRTRTYEIKPNFRKGLQQWNAYMGDKNRQASMVSTLQGRRTTNGNFYTRDNLSVMEDDEYDDDEDDYNEEGEDDNERN